MRPANGSGMANLRSTALALASLALGCGGAATPAAGPAAGPTVAPAATAKSADDGAKPKASQAPAHWTAFPGPKVKAALSTKSGWAAIPIGHDGDYDSLKIALLDFRRVDGFEVVFKSMTDDADVFVPAAMVRAAEKAVGVVKGSAVMADVAAASGFGRVVSIEAGDEPQLTIKYQWGGSVSDTTLGVDHVILVDDKLAFGQMAALNSGGSLEAVQVAYTGKDKSWVIEGTGKPTQVDTKDLKAMKMSKVFKKGDKVLAGSLQLKPAQVTDVLDDGTAYKVKYADGKEDRVEFSNVTAPL